MGVNRRRFGQVLVGVGLATILIAVIYVLEVANGPGTGPKAFAQRRGYDRVKASVHETFPLAFAIGNGVLGLTIGLAWLLSPLSRTASGARDRTLRQSSSRSERSTDSR